MVLQKIVIDLSELMNSDSDAEIDTETPFKTITFSDALHCFETVKTYLLQQDVWESGRPMDWTTTTYLPLFKGYVEVSADVKSEMWRSPIMLVPHGEAQQRRNGQTTSGRNSEHLLRTTLK
ncbi:hypothetical protein TNCV_47541 [Trichonephila clavipes]|nr:hypothetical protein TNCV_47541 [Trichonephila clavipes]